jgi:MoxR-like ATPase
MTPHEQTLYELVSYGIRGDALAVRQAARRVLQRARELAASDGLCAALTRLLNEPSPTVPARSAATELAAGDGHLSMLRVEDCIGTPRPRLSPADDAVIEDLMSERRAAARLRGHGLEPVRSLLLTGMPGVGKTLTARYVAAQLELPMITLDLATVVSSFLGRTGQNLRKALDFARERPCVFLLDEFDAIAKRRDDPGDIGELKRIVNVLLLELEHWPSHGLLIAATNHPELLDRAIWRRFDRVLAIGLPDLDTRRAILHDALSMYGQHAKPQIVTLCALAAEGTSPADLMRLIREAARAGVMSGESDIGSHLARVALRELRSKAASEDDARLIFCALAVNGLNLPHRTVAEMINVSHTTVGRTVRRWEADQRGHDTAKEPTLPPPSDPNLRSGGRPALAGAA